jgi:DNA-binding NarL/FixJ family response regulator
VAADKAGRRAAGDGRSGMIRVLLADDQSLVRMGFRMVLDAHEGVDVIGEAGDGAEAIAESARLHPDVVVMDVRMAGMDGIEATRRISAEVPDSRVLILTTFDLDEYAVAGLRAGASGFLLKDVQPGELVAAIKTVASGDAVVAPGVTRRLLDRFVVRSQDDSGRSEPVDSHKLGLLTDRERDVLGLIAQGLSNFEIAAELHLSEATVKTHVSRILSKLEVRDRVQAVIFAYETRLVRPS